MIQLNPPLPLHTPKGDGWAHFLIDYSQEHDLLWVVFLNKGGDPKSPVDPDVVQDRTARELRGNPDLPVLVKADNAVPYGVVVRAMVILQKAGARKVGFLTDPLPQPQRRPN